MTVLKRGDSIEAATDVEASPDAVYGVVSAVERIPEWSPECVRVERIDDDTFRGRNRRRLGRWSTTARIVTAEPGEEFTFEVQLLRRPFTRWSYRMEASPEGTVLTETFTMCRDLPLAALLFEWFALGVRDRRSDLQGNLSQSVRTIRRLAEQDGR